MKTPIHLIGYWICFCLILVSPVINAENFRVNVKAANVRTGPSTSYRISHVLARDEFVDVITRQQGWWNIRWGQDNTGWMAQKLLRVASADRSSRNLVRIKPAADLANPRFALIIGNSAYSVGQLSNPQNDANDMTDALQRAGFKVTQLINATQRQMERAIIQFGQLLNQNNKSVGLFYYAGHGMQLGSNNYLIPIDAQLAVEDDIKYESVNVGRVLDAMDRAANRLNMVLLDACRDNPFARRFRSSAKGLAQMDAPSGTLIAYATAPGNTAADGIGRNGTFTKYLLKHMQRPGEPIELVLKRVRSDVMHETNHRQTPWESSSLVGNFSFVEGDSVIDIMTPAAPKPLLGRVIINSEPQQAKIYINDIYEGQAPLTLLLDLGVVTIRGEKIGYESGQEKVRIRKGRELKVNLLLNEVDVVESVPVVPVVKYRDGEVFRDSLKEGSQGPEMVVIPAGSFRMGDIQGGGDKDEKPVHEVHIKSFAMGRYEVTVDQFRQFVLATDYVTDAEKNEGGKNGCYYYDNSNRGWHERISWRYPTFSQTDNDPVACISWNDAKSYIKWLNQKTGFTYRLATEAEWEYVARAGTRTKYSFGNNESDLCRYGNVVDLKAKEKFTNWKIVHCSDGYLFTSPVGKFLPNEFGVYDMYGNVWEWVEDCWHDSYTGAPGNGGAKTIDCTNYNKVMRGGSWLTYQRNIRSANRDEGSADDRWIIVGFRVSRTF